MKMNTTLLAGFVGFGFIAGSASAASLIGDGAVAGGTLADGTGGRTNVDQAFSYLPAGTYNVNDFNYSGVNTSGTVQPFLATKAGTQHTPIWVGSAGIPSVGTNTVPYAPGTQQITLGSPTRIYSGFAMTANAVGYNNGGSTDHNGAPALTPVVGVPFAAFSNLGLGRTYSSGINVTSANPLSGGAVGQGAGITTNNQDTPGGDRLNVDLLFTTLVAGTYSVDDWRLNVFANDQGDVTPMLLTGSPSSYSTLWVGSAFDPTTNGVQTVGESGTFTLAETTEIYAAFVTDGGGSGIIALDKDNASGGLSLTDHDSTGFTVPTGAGQTVDTFSNPGLARTYAFEINTSLIPEPSAFGLLALSCLGLIVRRRR